MTTYTEGHIQRLLAQKFCAPQWAYFSFVPDTTGYGTRIADGVAMNLYPSNQLTLTCFEIKVSRSDLMAELKDITKSECIGKYCDYFTLVIPKGIVLPEELPVHWGILTVDGESMRHSRKPTKQENVAPLDRGFVASLLRRASASSVESQMAESLKVKEQEIDLKIRQHEDSLRWHNKSEERLRQKNDHFEKQKELFQQMSGIFVDRYGNNDELIPAFLQAATNEDMFRQFSTAQKQLYTLHETLKKIVDEFDIISKEKNYEH
jgi:hypothetical protein